MPRTTLLPRYIDRHAALLAALTLLLFGAVTLAYPQFASAANLRDSLDDTAILILLALGQMLVILTRGIDLSVAANVALSGLCVAMLNKADPGLSMAVVLLLAFGIGALLGFINGLLVWQVGIPSIVVTLGTMAVFRGTAYLISGGSWVTSGDMSPAFQGLVRGTTLGLSNLSLAAVLCALAIWVFLKYSSAGRNLYAAGNNPAAAAYIGVNASRAQCLAFTICGAISGLCGYLWAARFAVAYTDTANGFELTVIAACVIGGISIAGGIGNVAGLLLGCLFLGVIKNALPLLGVSPFWQTAVSGAVILGAVMLNASQTGKVRRRILEEVAS
jgi:rhamnose transport system permease protein